MFWNIIARFLARPAVVDWLIRRAMRTPYSHIVINDRLYMERYWLFNPYPLKSMGKRPRWQFPISIRLHHILLPDPDRHHHDHPWNARTVILRGCYCEVRRAQGLDEWAAETLGPSYARTTVNERFVRTSGETTRLRFGEFHRITAVSPGGVWTLFITGRYRGTWGFDVDGVKVPHDVYLAEDEA